MTNRFGLPNLGFGMGLRTKHYPDILDKWPEVDWFEVISENFMETDGRPRRILERVREHYPIVMHGVGLSIGSSDTIDMAYLQKLKALAEWLKPAWVSDHVCWTGINKVNSHDLLPMPYTEESLALIVDNIKRVQDYLGRTILLENPSTYLEFKASHIPEWEFIARMAEEADCGLLLDVNNVYVSCYNHRLDPKTYLDAIPTDRVVQIHLAGHENHGTHIVDTHSDHVVDRVWDLYSYAISRIGAVSTMVEWDENIPEFSVLKAEVEKAKAFAGRPITLQPEHNHNQREEHGASTIKGYVNLLGAMQEAILSADMEKAKPEQWIRAKKDFAPDAQLNVYVKGYRYRLFDIVSEDYNATRYRLGDETMDRLLRSFVEETPSNYYNLSRYAQRFPDYIRDVVAPDVYELARLEGILTEVFDEPETLPLSAEALSALDPEAFFTQKLPLRKACRLSTMDYATNAFYSAFHQEEKPKPSEKGEYFLAVFRHEDSVWRMELEKEEYQLLGYLKEGYSIGDALEKYLESDSVTNPEGIITNLQQWLARWVRNGLLAEASSQEGDSKQAA